MGGANRFIIFDAFLATAAILARAAEDVVQHPRPTRPGMDKYDNLGIISWVGSSGFVQSLKGSI
jgi:hypothetical protein